MEVVDISKVLNIAEGFVKAGAKWHFHMLQPGCMFNGRPQNAFVIEDVSEGNSYISYSIAPHDDLRNACESILGSTPDMPQTDLSEDETALISHAKDLRKAKKDWHYHSLDPKCEFNEKEDKWTFIFESEESGDVREMFYDSEPHSLITELDKLKS